MIDNEFKKECHIFLCYRSAGAEIAKNFKKALSNISDRYFGYVWYSDQENMGNYVQDIKLLLSSAKYAVLFLEKGFTNGFLVDGKNNYGDEKNGKNNCVTVREIVEIERRRQTGELTVIGVNINDYTFQPNDVEVLKRVFENEGILTPSSLSAYTNLNKNQYYPRTTDVDAFTALVSRGMEKQKIITADNAPKVYIDNLIPPMGYYYYGRESVFNHMNAIRKTRSCVNIIAPAGSGKSAFVFHWLSRIAPYNYNDAEYVLYWSFEQGNQNYAFSSNLSDFFEYAISFFNIDNAIELSNELEKATAIATFMQEHSVLLIFDGMDVFQSRKQGQEGMLQNQAVKKIVTSVARSSNKNSLLLLLSSTPVADLQYYVDRAEIFPLPRLTPKEGVKILRDIGVNGSEQELTLAVNELCCDPMSITLLGKLLVGHYNGNIRERYRVSYSSRHVEHVDQILSFYEGIWTLDTQEGIILSLCCLFNRDINYESLLYLIDKIKQEFSVMPVRENDLRGIINNFKNVGLMYGEYDIKLLPIVKERCRCRFKEAMPEIFSRCNLALGKYYSSLCVDENVKTIAEMLPLYDAIFYYNQADDPQSALLILWERVFRKRQFFSQKQLGATTNDLFAISLFFNVSNDWKPNPKLSNIDAAWLCSVAAYLQNNIGNLRESELLRRRELEIYKSLNHHMFLASDGQNLARNLMLQGKLAESEQEFKRALLALEKAQEQNSEANPYAKDMDKDQLKTNILTRYAYLLYLLGENRWPQANEVLNSLREDRLRSTGMFNYCYIRLHIVNKKEKIKICDIIERKYIPLFDRSKKHERTYASFLMTQISLIRAKGLNRSKAIKECLNYGNSAIEDAKSVGRMDQLPLILNEMLALYLSLYENEKTQRGKKRFLAMAEGLMSDLDETFSIYDLPIYRIEYLFLKAQYYFYSGNLSEAQQLYQALCQSPICRRYFMKKIQIIEKLLKE